MCGIFAITSNRRNDIGKILVECAEKLTYRGYDTVGVATVSQDRIHLRKDKGKFDEVAVKLRLNEMRGSKGIAQLRWATFGAPSKLNAQPHLDCDEDLCAAHNGNIVNFLPLREQYTKEGHTVRSMNDGEICVHAVEKYYDQLGDMVEAIRKGCGDLKGDYAFAAMHKDDNKVYAVKMGSSLFVGIGEGETCVSSDLPSILPVTRQILNIHDGELVILSPEKVEIRRISDGHPIERNPYTSDADIRVAQKGGYPHFMLKEIHEQVSTTRTLFSAIREPYITQFIDALIDAKRVFFVACGSSYHATVVGSYYFNDLANIAAIPVIGGQFNSLYGDSVGNGDVVICVSQSGETKDVIDVVHLCKKKNVKILSVVNVLGSTLTHLSDLYLPMGSGFEISVPATKTYTSQVTLFAYLATLAGQKSEVIKPKAADALINDLQTRLPALIEETISTTTLKARTLAPYLSKFSHFYVLGHGLTHGVALEGALKIKEVCYIVADGMYSSEFKHGPLSIVENGYPIIFTIAPDDAEHIVNHLAEVECRGARIIATGGDHPLLRRYVREEDFLVVPKSSQYLSPILQVIPLQLIAYHLATYKNIDPDYPRNISKTLTVR
ncbi:MAG: glutamine--fructose-6-phosphate transaminase (isomerizing) [Candidatus Hermodarchaeota archaeon]|nr:glutamine--fructose-6-phosphate transaminase (isomerizing) [Candidatus Hermodarchaeota archaeon]